MRQLMRRLRQSAARGPGDRAGDGELLDAFRHHGDREALAALVERHGAMVLGVCRRVLSDQHDADDAFQATFLVLLRNAAAVRPASRVGAWLHGVAYRTALAARVAAARRRRLVPSIAARIAEERIAPAERDELRAIIDREIARLPESFRAAVVQCDLLGRSRKDAAAELGWPEGTLSARLARARRLLGDRLTRAGLAPAAAMGAVSAAESSRAAVPPALAHAVRQWIDNPEQAPEVVRLLADQVRRTMAISFTRRLAALSIVILAGAVALGAAVLGGERPQPPADKPRVTEKPAALKADPGWHLILEKDDRRVALKLGDGTEKDLAVSGGLFPEGGDPLSTQLTVSTATSPDGQHVAYEMTHPRLGRRNGMIKIADADARNMRDLTDGKQSYYPAWAPDGKRIAFLSDRSGEWHLYSIAADATKDNAERLSRNPVPDNCRPCFAADGRLIHTVARGAIGKLPLMDLVTWDGRVEKKLVEKNYVITYAISPDGSKLAYVLPTTLAVHDLKTGAERRWKMDDVDAKWQVAFFQILWRPDGGALGLSFAFLGDLQQGARVAGDDYVGVLSLDAPKPALRTYKVGTGCRLFGWAMEADLSRKK